MANARIASLPFQRSVESSELASRSANSRAAARSFMWLAALAPVCGVMAYSFDGIYIGATWARDMRNLMVVSFAIYLATWWLLLPFGNAGLWGALLLFFMARGLLQAWRDLMRQYRWLFEIGAANRARGFRPMRWADFLRDYRREKALTPQYPPTD